MSGIFRNTVDESYCSEPAHLLRWKKTVEFVGRSAAAGKQMTSGLDLGDRTPLTTELERIFGCTFMSSSVDLDTGSLEGEYHVVCAFEVLEHLFNPLHCLLEVRKVLSKDPGARVFVSSPLTKPQCLQSPDHFHEMSRRSIEALFERAGFNLVRSREFRIRPWFFYLTGVKPLMRFIVEKIQIYELARHQE